MRIIHLSYADSVRLCYAKHSLRDVQFLLEQDMLMSRKYCRFYGPPRIVRFQRVDDAVLRRIWVQENEV